MSAINIFGLFIGILIFVFTLIISKKVEKLYLAPLITFIIGILIILYGFFKVGGFEGLGYGFLGVSIATVAFLGVLFLPFFTKRMKNTKYNKLDQALLIMIPFLLFSTIIWTLVSSDPYWTIDEGYLLMSESTTSSYYQISTISEGKKQVHIQLGNDYEGSQLEINTIRKIGNTEIIIHITNSGGEEGRIPYSRIGIDQIVEPLTIKTDQGEIIHSKMDVITQ
ncbi:YesK family protein [Alkalihalobacillus trypoxylicola]|uniref:YesK-like protein n=1 Tax=Alkalihalobacillus trypoxylicola TaxID=519424 RepID=A0A161PAI5_9BACI|nr:YesK family protein [Alkalihalobacillus trypoxylicola]KYG28241.1 hypothetical protein AZF04_10100 [Alkalihalobacillus trypoxylicola]